MSFRPRDFRRSTWVRAWRSAALWLCVVTLALQPLASLAAIRQQTPVAIGAPAATSAGPSVQLLWGTRTAEYAEKDISFAAVSAVGFTPRPPQLAPLPSPPRQSLTLSGAQPPYPPNHVLDGSVEVVGTPPQGAVGYAYNDAGQRTGMTLPGGRTVGYGYDAAGRLSSVSDWQGGAATLGYDVDGSLSSVTRSSGVATSYGYDGAGRLSAVSHSGPTGTLQSYVYTLDANGNRTGVTTQTGSESYAYDALDRLTSVGYTNGDTVSYGYDAAGKRLTETFNGVTTTYDYDAAGQVVSNGVLSYTYDANGNLTGAGSDAYAWDWGNRLAGASVGSSSIAYSYDALGVRTGAVVDGVASSFLWDRVTGQLVDDGGQGYVQAPGVLAQLGAAGRGDLLADGTGSVRGIADASGNLVGTADFGIFGQNRGQAGATSSVGSGGAFWTAALRDQSQAPAGLVSAALFGALPTPIGSGGSNSVSTALAHLERLQQVNPTPNRFVGSASDSESGHSSWGGFGGGGAPVGSPALALLLPQTSDPEPANQLPGPYTYASHPPMQGNGGTSGLPGANPGLFAAWLLGLEANEDPGGLIGLGQAIVRVFLYVACVLDGECLASLTELQALGEELGSSAQVTMRWTGRLLSRAADLWPLLPNIPKPLAELLSFGLGFIPVVGDLYDLYCGLTGYDPITGERLAGWERGLSIGAAFMPLASRHNLGITAKAPQWLDDVATLFRTGISGGTLRRIGRAQPEGVTIGVRGRPVMAALWEAVYRHTGWFVPKPAKEMAEELFALKRFGIDTGLRKMRDKKTGKIFWAHSDIDIQVIAQNGVPMNPKDVKKFVRELNTSIGGNPFFQHADNISGVLGRSEGAALTYLQQPTILISHGGSAIVENATVFLNDDWRAIIEGLISQPNLK